MLLHTIGEITLSASTLIYFFWFIPQLYLNFKRKDTEGLSFWMHGLLFLGYSADLLYGFGRHMQWQYRAVTLIGLVSLSIQHYQIGRYGLHTRQETFHYYLITLLILLLFGYAFYNLAEAHHTKSYYDIAGMISNTCWFTYLIPQIVKNYVNKSTEGLSVGFIVLTLLISVFDLTAAITLHWDWPSLIGAPVTFLKKGILLGQYVYYKRRSFKQYEYRV